MAPIEHCSTRPHLLGLLMVSLTLAACGGAGDQTGPGQDQADPTPCAERIDCVADDDCCPPECDGLSDPDCAPVCGNGVLEPGETCEGLCQIDCDDQDACTLDALTGAAETCDLACEHERVRRCRHADGCCPAGCDALTDVDCAPVCGNGIVEPGETCDGNCPRAPADCPEEDCSRALLIGRADDCSAICSLESITACGHGDGCCPEKCDALNDDDCEPVCGNGVIEPGETCDGDCPQEPADCEDGDACTVALIEHGLTECESSCGAQSQIVACRHGDGCCPDHCDILTDDDCEPCPAGEHPCAQGCCAWDSRVVAHFDTSSTSLALDSRGRAHLVYEKFDKSFGYAREQPWGWDFLPGPPGTGTGYHQVLRLDAQDRPHVTWWDEDGLHYAVGVGDGLWSFCSIASSDGFSPFLSRTDMVLDSEGHPAITHPGGQDRHLELSRLDGSWRAETVDPLYGTGSYTALAIDDQGEMHIAISNLAYYNVSYSYEADDGWHTEGVGTIGYNNPGVAMAVSSDGQPHIAYQSDEGLVVMSRTDQGWAEDAVEVCQACDINGLAIAIDPLDQIHLIYSDAAMQRFVYVRQSAGRWVHFDLTSELPAGARPSLVLDDAAPVISLSRTYPYQIELWRW